MQSAFLLLFLSLIIDKKQFFIHAAWAQHPKLALRFGAAFHDCFLIFLPMHKFDTGRARCACMAMAVSALLCLTNGSAKAQEGGALPTWTFGGYGRVGAAHSSERQADYTATVLTPGEAGYTQRISAALDSRVGAQLAIILDHQWSATCR